VGSKSICVGLYYVARSQLVNTYQRFRIANKGGTAAAPAGMRSRERCAAPSPAPPSPSPTRAHFYRQGCATVPINFVIADGIIAMEGNGPLNGTPRPLGKIVLSGDPVAADAHLRTCARLMGFEPNRIPHIREPSRFLGNSSTAAIDQVGETLTSPASPFQVVQDWGYLIYEGSHR
jgi:hypothetical protein